MAPVSRTLQVLLSANVSSFQGSMYTAARAVNALDAELAKTTATSARATAGMDAFGASANAAGKSSALLKTAGVAAAAAVAIGLFEAGKAATEFDKNMRNVTSLIRGAGESSTVADQQYKAMSASVLELSKTLPQSANDLAKGLYDIVSSGFAGADALSVLKASATAASAGLTDTKTAAQAISGVINAYGLSASQAQQVSDVLFQTVNLGVVNFKELSGGIGEVVSIANAAHVPVQDLGAAIATVTRAGLRPAETFTGLTRAIQGIVQPSAALSNEFHKLGFNSGEAALQSLGLKGVIDKLRETTGGSITGVDALFHDVRAQKVVVDLMAQSGQLYSTVAGQMTDKNAYLGATFRALSEQQKSVSYQFSILRNNVEAAGISMVQKVEPSVARLLVSLNGLGTNGFGALTPAIDAIKPGIAALDELLSALGQIAGEVVRDIGPLAGALAGVAVVGLLDFLSGLLGLLAEAAKILADNRVIVDAAAVALAARYVPALAAAAAGTLLMNAETLALNVSTRLAAGGMDALAARSLLASRNIGAAYEGTQNFSKSLSLLNPYVLVAAVAIGSAAYVYNDYRKGVQEAKDVTEQFAKALQAEAAGTPNAVGAVVQLRLEHDKMTKSVSDAGISQATFADAVRGSKSAQESFVNSLLEAYPELQHNQRAQAALAGSFDGSNKSLRTLQDALQGSFKDGHDQQKVFALALEAAHLSKEFDNGQASAQKQTSALEQLGAASGPAAQSSKLLADGIGEIGNNSDLSKEALKALASEEKGLQSQFEAWAGPKTVFADAQKDIRQQQAATQQSTNDTAKQQHNALKDSQKAEQDALRQQKQNVSNRTAGSKSAIDSELADLKRKQKAQLDDLDKQTGYNNASKASTKNVADSAAIDMDRMIAGFKEKDDALAKFQDNLVKIAGKYGQAVAKRLQDLGPESATAIEQFANATGPKADQARKEIERNLDLTGMSTQITTAMNLASIAAGHGTDAIGVAAIAGLKGHTEELTAVASQYSIDLTKVADPILAQLGLAKVDTDALPIPYRHQGTIIKSKAEADQLRQSYADGGVETHSAEIARAGAMRVWAEPETGGEAYIPLHPAKRGRSLDILAQTANLMGMAVVDAQKGGHARKFADGGLLPFPPKLGAYPAAQPAQQTVNGIYLALARQIERNQSAQGSAGVPSNVAGGGHWQDITNALSAAHVPFTITSTTGGQHAPGSYHYRGKAVDLVSGDMLGIFNSLRASASQLAELFFTPAGYSIKNSKEVRPPIAASQHYNHVHAAVYDNGGPLMPGWTQAYNGTNKPEHVYSEEKLAQIVSEAFAQSGRSGAVIEKVVIEHKESAPQIVRELNRSLR